MKYHTTTLSLNDSDYELKEKLRKKGITIIDTWRMGAEAFSMELFKQRRVRGGAESS